MKQGKPTIRGVGGRCNPCRTPSGTEIFMCGEPYRNRASLESHFGRMTLGDVRFGCWECVDKRVSTLRRQEIQAGIGVSPKRRGRQKGKRIRKKRGA